MDMISYAKIKKLTSKAQDLNYLANVINIDEAKAFNDMDSGLTIPAIYQQLSVTVTGSITGTGNAKVTIISANINSGTPYELLVAVTSGQSATQAATAIINAINADETLSPLIKATNAVVGSASAYITLIQKNPNTNDVTFAVTIENGTCTGLTSKTGTAINELVHNSVLHFPSGWNGYQYWMMFTPYPASSSSYENPSIIASNDGKVWVVPSGVTNPLIPNTIITNYYNSDPCLVADPNGQVVHLIYRVTDGTSGTTHDKIYLASSSDGFKTVSTPVCILDSLATADRVISPAIIWSGTQWVMWTINSATTACTLVKRTCATLTGTWSEGTTCTITAPAGKGFWHFDIKKFGGNLYMLMGCDDGTKTGATLQYYIGKSTDGLQGETWELSDNSLIANLYGRGFYKGSFIPTITENGLTFTMWYPLMTTDYRWSFKYTEVKFNRTQLQVDYQTRLLKGAYFPSSDTFCDLVNRADEAPLGTATCGKALTRDASYGTLSVVSNAISPTTADMARSKYLLPSTDMYVSVKFASDPTLGKQYFYARFKDDSNYIKIGVYQDRDLTIVHRVGGSNAISISTNIKLISAGDIVSVNCKGTNVTVYVNLEPVYSFTDSNLAADGKYFMIQEEIATSQFQEVYGGPAI